MHETYIEYVSDGSQNLDSQRDALLLAGVDPNQLYNDLASGKHDDRPGLIAACKALRAGDVLVIYKLDRLGRVDPDGNLREDARRLIS